MCEDTIKIKPEDHWYCIAHLSAEDMLKSVVTEEKKFEHSPWAVADNPLGTQFWCQQEGLITLVICCKFKKNLFEVWFYTFFFMILYMYVVPGQGQTAPRGQSFDVNRNVLSLHSFIASLKKSLWSLILHNFFSWFNNLIFFMFIHFPAILLVKTMDSYRHEFCAQGILHSDFQ